MIGSFLRSSLNFKPTVKWTNPESPGTSAGLNSSADDLKRFSAVFFRKKVEVEHTFRGWLHQYETKVFPRTWKQVLLRWSRHAA